ncbi:50S ribosomal protein L17 [bacterium]|nr:50S ribosomal protein L17 [bacterium]
MKHKKAGRKLSRVRKQRRALKKTLLGSLIMNEKITTTEAKAKEIKPLIDKLVSEVKKNKNGKIDKVAMIRNLSCKISAEAVKKITGDYSKKFETRNSGYTRIIKLKARESDSAKMAMIEFV